MNKKDKLRFQKEQHDLYLQSLIIDKNFKLYALEFCINLLDSDGFNDVKMTDYEYLISCRDIEKRNVEAATRIAEFDKKYPTFEAYYKSIPETISSIRFDKSEWQEVYPDWAKSYFISKIDPDLIEKEMDELPF